MNPDLRPYGIYALLMLLSVSLVYAQDKPILQPQDYGKWENLSTRALSPNGDWVAYEITRVDETTELRIRAVADDTTHTTILWGDNPVFSPDGRWLAWTVGVSPDERERLQKAKEPVQLKAGLLNLITGETVTFDAVERMAFANKGGFLALLSYAPKEPSGKGADLRLLNLTTKEEVTFGNVGGMTWSDRGAWLAMILATGNDRGNGVQVYDAASGRLQSLDVSGAAYAQLTWRDDALDLAVLRSEADASTDTTAYELHAWRNIADRTRDHQVFNLAEAGIADTLEVVKHRRPMWSEDGRKLAIGLRPNERKDEADSTATDDADVDLPGVQIWHAADVRIIPGQQARASFDSRRTLLAVWDVEANRAVQVGTDLMERTDIMAGWNHALEYQSAPYPWGAKFGRPYQDVWLVNLAAGEREKVLEEVRYAWDSADGQYLLSFDGTHYWTTEVASGTKTNITASLDATFANTFYDTPTDMLPPHGVGGWLEDDAAVLLYDQFDVWRVAPDGSGGTRITQGAAEEVIHRVLDLDRDEEAIDPNASLYLSLRGEWTEQRGFARLQPSGSVERLVLEDRFLRSLTRADSTDTFLYQAEARNDSPDLFVAGADLRSPRQVSATNPFLDDYAWTHAELVNYTSEAGKRLQGALLYPVNHDPSQRYPMIVYTYEILSPQIHFWERPNERDYYNFAAWTQNGYFVLMPDIVYTAREPGVSALQAVRPAIQTVVDQGLVDSNRVGLIGHSWGGYQATYLPTRTNLFAASIAGAPLTDFISFMGQIHWNPGIPEVDHWETGQARMEVPFWEDPEAHFRNSPIHKVHEMETPLLMVHGDDDGVVEFFQATTFYNFARRAEKQMVLLVYEGEDHGFRQKANQIDYHRRILEWFGHYLKGEPAPSWIINGVSLEDHDAEKRRVATKNEE